MLQLQTQSLSPLQGTYAHPRQAYSKCDLCAAACATLACPLQEGRRVLVLEKSLEQPDRIVGELLQPGGYLMLKRLGLESCVEGIDAQRVEGYAIIKNGRDACVQYPTEGFDEDVAGRSFHHGRCVPSRYRLWVARGCLA